MAIVKAGKIIDAVLEFFTVNPSTETWVVTTQCPLDWPIWAFDYLCEAPYPGLHPGDVLVRSKATGKVWKREA